MISSSISFFLVCWSRRKKKGKIGNLLMNEGRQAFFISSLLGWSLHSCWKRFQRKRNYIINWRVTTTSFSFGIPGIYYLVSLLKGKEKLDGRSNKRKTNRPSVNFSLSLSRVRWRESYVLQPMSSLIYVVNRLQPREDRRNQTIN